MVRLLLADDHALMREGLKQLFEYADGIEVIAEAVNGEEVLARLQLGGFDLILLDVTMPGLHGAELIKRIRKVSDTPILMLSMHNEAQVAARKLKAGASGYITKDSAPKELIAAVHKVAEGGRYISAGMAERIAFEVGHGREMPHSQLTTREMHIFRLLVGGARPSDAARQLGISIKTVSAHKANIKQKMNFTSDAQLTRYALEHGLLE